MKERERFLIKNMRLKFVLWITFTSILSGIFSYLLTSALLPFASDALANYRDSLSPQTQLVLDMFSFFKTIVSIVIAIFIITIFSKRMLKPIRALSKAADRVAHGEFDVQIPIVGNKNEEINVLTANFNTMAKELSAISMINNNFISNMSHEFKTPISSIKGFATLLYNSDLTEEQKDYAKIIIDEATRLSGLATNILKLTKLENQTIITDKQKFLLDEQIRHCVLLLQNEWSNKNIDVLLELPTLLYYGNPDLMQQIWLNLLSNAIKFTHEYGEINVTARFVKADAHNLMTEITIKDNGTGMDEQTLLHIFDKFYQSKNSNSYEGNGLGLTLVKRITELCGGTVEVKSAPRLGSEFIIKLPLDEHITT